MKAEIRLSEIELAQLIAEALSEKTGKFVGQEQVKFEFTPGCNDPREYSGPTVSARVMIELSSVAVGVRFPRD